MSIINYIGRNINIPTDIITKEPIVKTYLLKDLLDPPELVTRRAKLIEEVSSKFSFIPVTRFFVKDNHLIYIQERIFKKRVTTLDEYEKLKILCDFSLNLDSLSHSGFVHGDLHRLNIIFDGDKLNLIDLEPSLVQRRKGKVYTMCSAPKRSLNDIRSKNITYETDKIGFFLFCHQLFKIKYFNIPIKEVSLKRKNSNWEFLPINESDFVKLSFLEIFELFHQLDTISQELIIKNIHN
jgi:tRNA A-37 threonylcarbamoyl transferase component Bud32